MSAADYEVPVEHTEPDAAMESLAALLAQGREERFCALVLTDEELSVLTSEDGDQVAPFPWLAELPARHTEVARTVALRGLVARELVVPTDVDLVSGETDLGVDNMVLAVLGARRAASDIVVAQRRSDAASWFKAVYLQGEHGVIEEDVSPGGVHYFWFSSRERLAKYLMIFCDPLGAAQGASAGTSSREVDLAAVARGEASLDAEGEARLITTVSTVDHADGGVADLVTALAFADHVEIARTAPGSDHVSITPVDRDGLYAACALLVDGLTGS